MFYLDIAKEVLNVRCLISYVFSLNMLSARYELSGPALTNWRLIFT